MHFPTDLSYPLIAVGDLHGQSDALESLLASVAKRPGLEGATFVFLGDFCDRGPDSEGVVSRVLDLVESGRATAVAGNHDLALVRAAGLDGLAPSAWWRDRYLSAYECDPTFRSYLGRPFRRADPVGELVRLRDAMPAAHRDFLASLPWVAEASGHLFVHCGLSEALRLSAKAQVASLRRREWLGSIAVDPRFGYCPHGEYPAWLGADRESSAYPLAYPRKVQVTGHEYTPQPDVGEHRIRIDTTGGHAGRLTAAVFRSANAKPAFVRSDPISKSSWNPFGSRFWRDLAEDWAETPRRGGRDENTLPPSASPSPYLPNGEGRAP